ncbi:hypothetical protein SLEP1_g8713 [Rubroshorea leprosula]|uniref:Uncharacterized protein n=1 Tax=Rubroshorea leprosula TaxID=152421 RepID=A0AAV5IBV1_9ROSI|nr:hypothetical protein SLEP1_g8713 [Rubroshorea leprosula]
MKKKKKQKRSSPPCNPDPLRSAPAGLHRECAPACCADPAPARFCCPLLATRRAQTPSPAACAAAVAPELAAAYALCCAPRQPSPALLCTNPALYAQIACTLCPNHLQSYTPTCLIPFPAIIPPLHTELAPPLLHRALPLPPAPLLLRLLHSAPNPAPLPPARYSHTEKTAIPDKIGILVIDGARLFFIYFIFLILFCCLGYIYRVESRGLGGSFELIMEFDCGGFLVDFGSGLGSLLSFQRAVEGDFVEKKGGNNGG